MKDAFLDWHIWVNILVYWGVSTIKSSCLLIVPFPFASLTLLQIVCPLYGISLFLPTIIRELGYQSSQAQLMTVRQIQAVYIPFQLSRELSEASLLPNCSHHSPNRSLFANIIGQVPIYITAAILAVVAAYFSDRVGKRSPFIIGFLLMMAVGFSMCIGTNPKEHPRVVYGGVFIAACAIYPAFPGVITWLSNNLSGSLKRSVGMALQIGVGNLGGVSTRRPLYPR